MLKPAEKQFVQNIDGLGKFVFRYPTLMDEIEADKIAAKLLGDNPNPSIPAANIAAMTGALKMAIVEAPERFDLDEIYSYDELEAVYNAFAEKVSSFRGESVFAKQKRAKEEGSQSG